MGSMGRRLKLLVILGEEDIRYSTLLSYGIGAGEILFVKLLQIGPYSLISLFICTIIYNCTTQAYSALQGGVTWTVWLTYIIIIIIFRHWKSTFGRRKTFQRPLPLFVSWWWTLSGSGKCSLYVYVYPPGSLSDLTYIFSDATLLHRLSICQQL